MSVRDLIESAKSASLSLSSPSFSLLLDEREERTSADTLINGLGHAIPRDPFEKLRTIDLARFRNEGCTLTVSLALYRMQQRRRSIGMSSHSGGYGDREGDGGCWERDRRPRNRERSETIGESGGGGGRESGSAHRWLRLPRWMYKGGLGSREPEARALVHM